MRLRTIVIIAVASLGVLLAILYSTGFRLEERYIPWLLSATSISLTIVTTTIAINRDRRRQKEYSAIDRLVEKEELETEVKKLVHKKTKEEEDISFLENQLKAREEKINALEEFVRRDLPEKARTAAVKIMLEERVVEQEKELSRLFEEWKRTKESLPTTRLELPQELTKTIEKTIEPRYVIERKLENAKSALAVMTTVFAIVTVVFPELPDPISFISKFVLLVPIAIISVYLIQNYRKTLKLSPGISGVSLREHQQTVLDVLEVVGLGLVLTLSGLGVAFGLLLLLVPSPFGLWILGTVILLPSVVGLVLSAMRLRKHKW